MMGLNGRRGGEWRERVSQDGDWVGEKKVRKKMKKREECTVNEYYMCLRYIHALHDEGPLANLTNAASPNPV